VILPDVNVLLYAFRTDSVDHARDLCGKSVATGNLVRDAWFAALAVESGCEWITTDGDFARFPGLRWHRPF
jgi:hypothetical protein